MICRMQLYIFWGVDRLRCTRVKSNYFSFFPAFVYSDIHSHTLSEMNVKAVNGAETFQKIHFCTFEILIAAFKLSICVIPQSIKVYLPFRVYLMFCKILLQFNIFSSGILKVYILCYVMLYLQLFSYFNIIINVAALCFYSKLDLLPFKSII